LADGGALSLNRGLYHTDVEVKSALQCLQSSFGVDTAKFETIFNVIYRATCKAFTTRRLCDSRSGVGNLAERDPIANTKKKTCEMIVDPDVDGYTETLNHRKILRNTQKSNLLKTKRILKTKHS